MGTWDYNTLKFDFDNSIRQVAKYATTTFKWKESSSYVKWIGTRIFSDIKNFSKNKEHLLNGDFSKIDIVMDSQEIPALKQQQIYPLYNQDYQDYKQRFNKGLNFRVFSKDKTIKDKFYKGFYIVKVPSDEASMAYFRVEI